MTAPLKERTEYVIFVRPMRSEERRQIGAELYDNAGAATKERWSRVEAIENFEAYGVGLIAIDCLGARQGYALLVDKDPDHPWLCWAEVSPEIESAGVARDMVRLLIANYVAANGSRAVKFCSATGAGHHRATKSLQQIGFQPGDLVLSPIHDGEVAEFPTAVWRLPHKALARLLKEAIRLENIAYREAAKTGLKIKIIFSEPVTTTRGLREQLDVLIRSWSFRND